MKLEISNLPGRWVQLEPLAELHREGLRTAASDERIWVHTLTRAQGAEFDLWFNQALAENEAGQRVAFAVRRLADGELLGSTSYLDIHLRHRRLEIGSTWYHPSVWSTAVNPECKLLLLTHAFEVLGVNRVALVTDARNERSQAAIAKLGAVREGILRAHAITQGGRVRDSVLFSIVAAEWPQVRSGLLARLADFPEDARKNCNTIPLPDTVSEEIRKFQGTWRQVACEKDGISAPPDEQGRAIRTTFTGNTFLVALADGSILIQGTYQLDPTQEPRAVDWTDTSGPDAGKTFPAIYSLEGDQLIFCAADEGQERPTEFRTRPGQVLRVHQRDCTQPAQSGWA